MKRINDMILRKCKSLRHFSRSSSYSSPRSMSMKSKFEQEEDHGDGEVVYMGSAKRRYVIDSKHLSHPIVSTLIERSKQNPGKEIWVRCEVVMFEHLLWMLDNADDHLFHSGASLEELADLYVF